MRVAAYSGRPLDALMGLLWGTVDRYLLGDPMADRWLAELGGRLQAERHEAVGFVLDAMRVMLTLRAGRLSEAEALAARCAQAGEAAGDVDAAGWYAAQVMVIRWYQSRAAELVPDLLELASAATTGAVDVASFAGLAVAHAAAGDVTRAACALARARGHDFTGIRSSWLVASMPVSRRPTSSATLTPHGPRMRPLFPFADLPIMTSLAVACLGSTQHPLGVAALTMGQTDVAADHLRAALRANQSLGHVPATVLTRHRLGQVLAQRDHAEDRQEGAAHLSRAATEAAALGLVLPTAPRTARGWNPEGEVLAIERQSSRLWVIRQGHRAAVVPDSTGMRYLAVLAERPGAEVSALELVRATVGATRAPSHQASRLSCSTSGPSASTVSVSPSSRTSFTSSKRTMTSSEPRWYAPSATGSSRRSPPPPGSAGQSARLSSDGERARIAVTKAIRRAVNRVRAADPWLGELLATRLRTGSRCCLDPA